MRHISILMLLVCTCLVSVALAQPDSVATITASSPTVTLINGNIDESNLVVLAGNTRPEANAKNDRGRVADDFRLGHMTLQLRRSPAQERALEQLIDRLHDPASPEFHHWLTAQQLGKRYGLAQTDIRQITGWLRSYGFNVNSISRSRMTIDFSGTAGQVRRAFHTEIHKLQVDGVKHIANMSDPKIPAALAPAVVGVVSLHDFRPQPMHVVRPDMTFDCSLLPSWERPLTTNTCYSLVPADLATIYNLNPLFSEGISGQGQTIALVEPTDIYDAGADWDTFRSTFGLSSSYSSGSFTQVHPNTDNNCSDPGVNDNEDEATVDAEWASASAPSAAIELASCEGSDFTNITFGVFVALQNLLDGANPPAIVSVSYGVSETFDGATFNAAINTLYQQAVTEGVSVFVSSGDSLAAYAIDRLFPYTTHGINVSGWASTVYNVAVGGTDFSDTYFHVQGSYWSSSNGSTYGSALSYVPEIPWNDSCGSVLLGEFFGFPTTYGAGGFCNSSQGANFLNVIGASGGPSGCATGAPSTPGVVSGTCAGYAKPWWQSVLGNPADGVRDLPDISLHAADAFSWGHAYVYCFSDASEGGLPCTGSPSTWSQTGGTSFSAPIMAGIQSLVNQSTGERWGNPNPTYYWLAASEYGASGNSACNSSLGKGVASSCIFYDVTIGDIDAPCEGSNNCYLPSDTYGVLSTSNSSYEPAYAAQTGWDFATGIGTVNAYNLVNGFSSVLPAVTLSPTSVNFGYQAVNITSSPQVITLTNTGLGPLLISSIGITGTNSGDFAQTNNCPSQLMPTDSCSISVTFTPTTTGTRNAFLSISDNAPGSPQLVPLTGQGVVPIVVINPKSLTFPTQVVNTISTTQILKLADGGLGELVMGKIVVTGDFWQTNTCYPNVLPAGVCYVLVTFNPTAKGSRTGSITFNDNAGVQTVPLKGTGTFVQLAPTSVAFGNQTVGVKSASRTITLTNEGNAAVSITGISITGANAGDFAETNTCGSTVAAGAQCAIQVTFTPLQKGKRTANVSVSDNGGGSPQTVVLTGTGT